ncbi:MAG: LamG domain-containing protein [Bacillota bacterium]
MAIKKENTVVLNLPLIGRCNNSDPPISIGTNFRNLKNLRYINNALKAISGMTKINNTALSNFHKTKNAFQFRKEQPSENHLLAHIYNSDEDASIILQNTTTIPNQGDFVSESLGSELVTNGTFTGSLSGWTAYDSVWSYGTNNAVCNGTTISYIYQTISCKKNKVFKLIYTVSNYISGTLTPAIQKTTVLQSGDIFYGTSRTANGSYVDYMISPDEGSVVLTFNNSTDSNFVLDDVSCKEVTTILWGDSYGAAEGRFAPAPNGQMVYCNGVDTCIWGGDETRIGGFINFDPDGSFFYDFTEQLRNTLDDSKNIAVLHSPSASAGIDSYTKLMLHCNGADNGTSFPDSSGNLHDATAVGNACTKTGNKKFGTASGYFDGTGDYLTVADHADFNLSGGTFTIDLQVYQTARTTGGAPIFFQKIDDNNYMGINILSDGRVYLEIRSAANVVVGLTSSQAVPLNTWTHVEVSRDNTTNTYYIFINGQLAGSETDTDKPADYTLSIEIGHASLYYTGYIDEYRISNGVCRHTSNFDPPTFEYSTSATGPCYFYIGTTRPAKGFKIYMKVANTSTSTMSGYYWDGNNYTSLSNFSDGTSTGGKSLAQTGSVIFDSTVATAKLKIINGVQLYWYKFSVNVVDTTTSIKYVTADMPFQTIKDIWDGNLRTIASFRFYRSAKKVYKDFSVCVATDNYESTNNATFAKLNGVLANDAQYFGFTEQICGLALNFAEQYTNETNNCSLSVYYWNGNSWTMVSGLEDGTKNEGITYGKNGFVTWTPLSSDVEYKKSIGSNDNLFYFYKVTFSKDSLQTADDSIRLYYVGGIPAQKNIRGYKFPMFDGERVWLCNNTDGDKNSAICSMANAPDVYNGEDSMKIFFGDESELMTATSLYVRLANDIFFTRLFFKKNEIWSLTGEIPEKFIKRRISDKYGCVAPLTLRIANAIIQDIPKIVAIWQGADGIYIFDQNSIICISEDIRSFFDKVASVKLNTSKISDSFGFYDSEKNEYHWLFATGSSTTLNNEWVYDMNRGKWFEIARGTGRQIQAACPVEDTNGNHYSYGFIDTGYIERLEYGNTFDGTALDFEFQFGDFPLIDNIMYKTKMTRVKLISVAKTLTSANISIFHYGDASSTVSQTAFTQTQQKSGYELILPVDKFNHHEYTFHSLKFTVSTDNETFGFEPVMVGILGEVLREDLEY